MKTIYFDCFMGISGDMTLGAMVDAGLPLRLLKSEIKKLGLTGYKITSKQAVKAGISAAKVTVTLTKTVTQPQRNLIDIVEIINNSGLEKSIRDKSIEMFTILGEAESKTHSIPLEKVHFHEVGAVDSIIDIVGTVVGFTALGIERAFSSEVNTGSGVVKTSHGVLPVPTPVTAELLKGIPNYAYGPKKELTTPTGALILKSFCEGFGERPLMNYRTIGNGSGGYDFENQANIMRVFIGDMPKTKSHFEERLIELVTNIDDMSPQVFPVITEKLLTSGALDVTVTPTQMKKGRPGFIVTVLCNVTHRSVLESLLLENTTTIGLRRREVSRVYLPRMSDSVKTKYGLVKIKTAVLPNGTTRSMPEFDSVKKLSESQGESFGVIHRATMAVIENKRS